jgi:hypothetical protein
VPFSIECLCGVCALAWDAALRGLGCGTAWHICGRPRPIEAAATHASAVLLLFFRASLISGVYFAYSIVCKLFESARFGLQAFNGAKAFNGDIAAWNAASMTTIASVCAHCFTNSSSMIMGTTHSTEALSDFAPAQPPQLRRISTVDRQHVPPHALGPLDAVCTECN